MREDAKINRRGSMREEAKINQERKYERRGKYKIGEKV